MKSRNCRKYHYGTSYIANARAQLRVLVKRILRKYGYPPDKQEQATELVLEQTEVLCSDWVER